MKVSYKKELMTLEPAIEKAENKLEVDLEMVSKGVGLFLEKVTELYEHINNK